MRQTAPVTFQEAEGALVSLVLAKHGDKQNVARRAVPENPRRCRLGFNANLNLVWT
jgi:hypothetical protein